MQAIGNFAMSLFSFSNLICNLSLWQNVKVTRIELLLANAIIEIIPKTKQNKTKNLSQTNAA